MLFYNEKTVIQKAVTKHIQILFKQMAAFDFLHCDWPPAASAHLGGALLAQQWLAGGAPGEPLPSWVPWVRLAVPLGCGWGTWPTPAPCRPWARRPYMGDKPLTVTSQANLSALVGNQIF